LSGGSSLTISECSCISNWVIAGGGAIYATESTATIADCSFISNAGDSSGAIYCAGSTLDVADCHFEDNWGDPGGGMGGIGVHPSPAGGPSLVTVSGSVFVNNGDGGAIECLNSTMEIASCTYVGHQAAYAGSTLIYVSGTGSIDMSNTIIAFNETGAVACSGSGVATVSCTDIFGNTGGDWVGCIAGQHGVDGNISEDPLFCNMPGGDYTIDVDSPCAPAGSGGCGLIGALPVGCGTTATQSATWGAVKKSFR
jgi:hypothetical protein